MSSNKLKLNKIAQNGTQSIVLKTVRDNMPISRTGIVEKTALPHSATSKTVACLLEDDILIEKPLADTNGPRRKAGISLNPQKGYCIAVEYTPHSIEAIALNTAYKKIAQKSSLLDLKTPKQEDKISKIINFIKAFRQKLTSANGKCLGLTLIDPGIVDIDNRTSIYCSTLDNWENVNLAEIIEEQFSLPVMLINTSMAKIRAIDRLDIDGDHNNLMYVEYGDGIGCGLKLAGNYIPGHHNLAGELGHVRVVSNPIPCQCGGVGCLETVAALPALAKNAKSAIKENTNSILKSYKTINGRVVLEAAAKGDRLAAHIVDEAFDHLGSATGGIVNILNPQVIVFDNLINMAGNQAITTLMRSLQKSTLTTHWRCLKVCISNIDSFIGPLGGAATLLDESMEHLRASGKIYSLTSYTK